MEVKRTSLAAGPQAGLFSGQGLDKNAYAADLLSGFWCGQEKSLARSLDGLDQFDRGLSDFLKVSIAERGALDQIRTDSKSKGSSKNEVGSIRNVHSAGGNKGSIWKRRSQRLEIFWATHIPAGKDLDQHGALGLRIHELGRR